MNYKMWNIYYIETDVYRLHKVRNSFSSDSIVFRFESLFFTLSPEGVLCNMIGNINTLCTHIKELENKINIIKNFM